LWAKIKAKPRHDDGDEADDDQSAGQFALNGL